MEVYKEIVIVIFLIVIDICSISRGDNDIGSSKVSFLSKRDTAGTNAWNTRLNNNITKVTIGVPGINSTSTTPWPELGQKRRNFTPKINLTNSNPSTTSAPQIPNAWGSRPTSRPVNHISTQGLSTAKPNNNKQLSAGFIQNEKSPEASTSLSSSSTATQNPTNAVNEDEELREFSESLLRKDTNNAANHVKVNYQGKTTSSSVNDQAPLPLLTVDNHAIINHPTISKFILLYNNYILDTTMNEYVTAQERTEENNLLDAVLATPVFQHTRNFLIQKGKISKDPKVFRDLMKTIWFTMYSRGGGKIGSSGFEHVFLAEIKNQAVSGLHNWVYFNDEEMKKNANYLGYLKWIDLKDKGAIVKYHFVFHGKDKPVGSMFIGTSPELEMALYSTCFILRPDQPCPLRLGGNRLVIRTYVYRYRGKNMIGSAFPEI